MGWTRKEDDKVTDFINNDFITKMDDDGHAPAYTSDIWGDFWKVSDMIEHYDLNRDCLVDTLIRCQDQGNIKLVTTDDEPIRKDAANLYIADRP